MIDSSIVTLIGLGFIGLVFLFLFLSSSRRTKEEAGQNVLYEERCTGRKKLGFGFSAGGNFPSWRIAFYESFFIIASIGSVKVLYSDVEFVEHKRKILSKGLNIKTRNPRMEIILFPHDPKKILAIFRSKNVSIEE